MSKRISATDLLIFLKWLSFENEEIEEFVSIRFYDSTNRFITRILAVTDNIIEYLDHIYEGDIGKVEIVYKLNKPSYGNPSLTYQHSKIVSVLRDLKIKKLLNGI